LGTLTSYGAGGLCSIFSLLRSSSRRSRRLTPGYNSSRTQESRITELRHGPATSSPKKVAGYCRLFIGHFGWAVRYSLAPSPNSFLWRKMYTKVLFALVLLLISSLTSQAQQLTAAQAKSHEGESATVCGVVAGEHTSSNSKGTPTFINLDAAYPRQIFTILVWGEDRDKVGVLPRNGEHVCVNGLITAYRGVPEIVVHSKQQLTR
jgi:hypothetical protein